MRTDFTCAIDGVILQNLDDRIYVEDVREEATVNNETAKRPGHGLILLHDPGRDSLDIKVTVFVKERDWTARMDVLQKVFKWASKGWFTYDHRPGQRIYVVCTKLPAVQTYDRKARFEISFAAYGEACWQAVVPTVISADAATMDETITIKPNGTRDCFLEAEFTPVDGALTSAELTAGAQTIALAGSLAENGETVRMYYDEMHYLRIERGNTSLADKRTAASSDHILLKARQDNTVHLAFNGMCSCTLTARGLYL